MNQKTSKLLNKYSKKVFFQILSKRSIPKDKRGDLLNRIKKDVKTFWLNSSSKDRNTLRERIKSKV